MPVQRTKPNTKVSLNDSVNSKYFVTDESSLEDQQILERNRKSKTPLSESPPEDIYYPLAPSQRDKYRTKTGKKLTVHQWAVYDFTRTIPRGKVTTYKEVSAAVGGSPRSVGSALRNNPFCPYVPCHRVIASNLFIGGFFGEWGKDHKTGTQYNAKVAILSQEGVRFNDSGHLLMADEILWKP